MMTPAQQPFIRQWGPPIGLCLTLLLVSYNISVIPPIMPPIVREFDSSVGYIQAVLVVMSLVTASFNPTAENLCRRFGRKRVFCLSLALFAGGILAVSFSPGLGIFALGYCGITGLASAALVSTPWALMDDIYDDMAERYAMLALTLSGVVGGLLGSLLGGLLAFELNWRWAFSVELVLVPIILLLVNHVPAIAPRTGLALDWFGGLLSFLGFAFTLVGVSIAGEYGWWFAKQPLVIRNMMLMPFGLSIVPVLIASGLICWGLFVFWQRQRKAEDKPSLLRMGLLTCKTFIVGLATGTLHTLVGAGLMFNLFQFIPAVIGLNSFKTALAVLPYNLIQVVVLIVMVKPRLDIAPRYLLQIGLALKCVGLWALFRAISPTVSAMAMLPSLLIMGVGTGLFLTYVSTLTFSVARADEKPEARGIYRPFQNLGQSLGRAILGTTLITLASVKIVDGVIAELGQAIAPETRRSAIFALQRAIQTFTRDEQDAMFAQLPASVQPQLDAILVNSAVSAMQTTMLVILVLAVVCLGLSFLLPKMPVRPGEG